MKIYSTVEPSTRITRARAAVLNASKRRTLPPKAPTKTVSVNSKRPALDENNATSSMAGVQHKRRAVLKDVTNVCCANSYRGCISAAKSQTKNITQPRRVSVKKDIKVGSVDVAKILPVKTDASTSSELEECTRSQLVTFPLDLGKNLCMDQIVDSIKTNSSTVLPQLEELISRMPSHHLRPSEEKEKQCKKNSECDLDIIDIDADHRDPLMCGIYAPDIYSNLRVTELIRRPCSNFVETPQRDITENMRGIMVDWLVEVSEEYKLTSDTLYLCVHLIDRFLSHNYIERQRLQLLGITCMLIASKYEEICAPHVEDFCFITDNTYTKEEVLTMETQVLNYLGFQLSVPTVKTFLRRYLQAAQATLPNTPLLELKFLSCYLSELTLLDYTFLKFLPSLIAASSVFLAAWTLNQSCTPWNPTLEYYTGYKASDLKDGVLALYETHLNSKRSSLNAVREKYVQEKFSFVGDLVSCKPLEMLF